MMTITRYRFRLIQGFLITLGAVLLTACGPNVVDVEPMRVFPRPVIAPYPAQVAIYFPEEFTAFTHVEERPQGRGGDWEIKLGPSQRQVFNLVFSALFASVSEVDEPVLADDSQAAALFVPKVKDLQFALPTNTKFKIFEIWVQYEFDIYDRDGKQVMSWPFSVYGKTPTAFLKSDSDAINSASIIALRDAGAVMVDSFRRDTRLKDWLNEQSAALSAPPAVQDTDSVAEAEDSP